MRKVFLASCLMAGFGLTFLPVFAQAPGPDTSPPGATVHAKDKPKSDDSKSEENFDVNSFLHSTILASPCDETSSAEAGQKPPLSEDEKQKLLAARLKSLTDENPVQQLLLAWLDWSQYWRTIYYILTFATLVFGGLATALHDGTGWWQKYKTIAALLVTISGGMNSALVPFNQHKKFDNAFSVLNTAKLNYLTNTDFSMCQLGKAVGYGEAIIHQNS